MTITDAKAYTGLIAGLTPTGTNVNNNVLVGEALATTSWTDADIAYSGKFQSAAASDVATLALPSANATESGSGTWTDLATSGSVDFEGVTIPALTTVYAVFTVVTVADTTSITIGGTFGIAGIVSAVGDKLLYAQPGGTGVTTETVTWTFGTGDGAIEVVVIGKTT